MKELEFGMSPFGYHEPKRHNEVAPNQFELAPIFEDVNLANDHNQLVMDLMKRIAAKHNFTVLLHEKPFKGVNGSVNITIGRSAPIPASIYSLRQKLPKEICCFSPLSLMC